MPVRKPADNSRDAFFARPDVDKILLEGVQEDAERTAFFERFEKLGGQIRLRVNLNISVDFIQDPELGDELDARHNDPSINVAHSLVEASIAGDKATIDRLRDEYDRDGGFLEKYVGVARQRLEQAYGKCKDGSGWLMGVGKAVLLGEKLQELPETEGGDGHFFVPSDAALTEPTVPLPTDSQDNVDSNGREILHRIMQNPAIALWVSDICSYRHCKGKGFAGAIEDRAYTKALEINANRKNKLEYAVAAMANMKALLDARGKVIQLFQPDFLNVISILLHTRRKKFPGVTLGQQRNKSIPVELPCGDMGSFLTDWYISAQKLRNDADE